MSLAAVRQLVALQLGVASVRPEDRLQEDLGAESADVMNLVANLEDRFEVLIPEEALAELKTVADLWARVEAGEKAREAQREPSG